MKKIVLTVAMLVATTVAALQVQAQSTSSEGNAANPAQSKTGNASESTNDGTKTRAQPSSTVTGSRPKENSMSDKSQGNTQRDREKRRRVHSDADGKTDVGQVKPKADPKTRKKRGSGRSFGNTGTDN
ncbi:hypothetical protein ACFPMF_20105 [Larkinella bovis]|uniref:Uncharacterized protein n=1 Tax=Larkinella bovis TaxID=683041 RepID=A0ABW0IEF9_9BACT